MSVSTNIHRPYVCDPLGPYISLLNNPIDQITPYWSTINPNRSLKLVLIYWRNHREPRFQNFHYFRQRFHRISFIELIFSNTEGEWSHLCHTIIFNDFMPYPVMILLIDQLICYYDWNDLIGWSFRIIQWTWCPSLSSPCLVKLHGKPPTRYNQGRRRVNFGQPWKLPCKLISLSSRQRRRLQTIVFIKEFPSPSINTLPTVVFSLSL